MTDELKPCPYCGDLPGYSEYETVTGKMRKPYRCENMSCKNKFRPFSFDEWQSRPIEDGLQKQIKDLQLSLLTNEAYATHLYANWQEEHTERIRLEERLKAANQKISYLRQDLDAEIGEE